MQNSVAVLENETHKLLWDFNIQTDCQILARRPNLIIINKKRELEKLRNLLSQLTTEENRKNVKRRISTTTLLWNMKMKFLPIIIGVIGTVTEGLLKELEDFELRVQVENYNTMEIGQNTVKGPGYLRRLAVTQGSVKDYQLTRSK